MRTRSKTDHIRHMAKQYIGLLRSVIKGLVARRDTVGGVPVEEWQTRLLAFMQNTMQHC